MVFSFVFSFLFAVSVFATTTTTLSGAKPLKLPDFSNVDPKKKSTPANIPVSFSCKTGDGNEVRKGESGFEDCLIKAQMHKELQEKSQY